MLCHAIVQVLTDALHDLFGLGCRTLSSLCDPYSQCFVASREFAAFKELQFCLFTLLFNKKASGVDDNEKQRTAQSEYLKNKNPTVTFGIFQIGCQTFGALIKFNNSSNKGMPKIFSG